MPVDAIFTPVRKVNYWVEAMRVGQMTNYDKLTIEIETDGTITPEEALSRSAEILVNQFRPFVTIGSAALPSVDGKVVTSVSVKGDAGRIAHYPAVLQRVIARATVLHAEMERPEYAPL